MKLVVIESPYAPRAAEVYNLLSALGLENVSLTYRAEREERIRQEIISRNLSYLRACMHDCLIRGEAPYASHALYTQEGVLDDNIPKERTLGIAAGFAWRKVAELTVVYKDLGISSGMKFGIEHSEKYGIPVEYRELGKVRGRTR